MIYLLKLPALQPSKPMHGRVRFAADRSRHAVGHRREQQKTVGQSGQCDPEQCLAHPDGQPLRQIIVHNTW